VLRQCRLAQLSVLVLLAAPHCIYMPTTAKPSCREVCIVYKTPQSSCVLLHAQALTTEEEGAAAEPAVDTHDATRLRVAPAEPSAAAATFVRPPPGFRLATTSLWVPTHGDSDHRASSGSDRGEGSGRGPHALTAGDGSDSIETTSTPVAAAPPHAYVPSDPSMPGTSSDDLLSRASARFGDGEGSSGHNAGTPGETRLAPWRIMGSHYRDNAAAQTAAQVRPRKLTTGCMRTSMPSSARFTCMSSRRGPQPAG